MENNEGGENKIRNVEKKNIENVRGIERYETNIRRTKEELMWM